MSMLHIILLISGTAVVISLQVYLIWRAVRDHHRLKGLGKLAQNFRVIQDIYRAMAVNEGGKDQQFSNALYEVMRIVSSQHGAVFALDMETESMNLVVYYENRILTADHVAINLADYAFPEIDKKMVIVNRNDDDLRAIFKDHKLFLQSGEFITSPIIFQSRLIGLLVVGRNDTMNHYNGIDIERLETATMLLGDHLYNYLLYQQKDRYLEKITSMISLSHELNQSVNIDQTLNTIVREAARLADCTACSIRLLNEKTNKLVIKHTYGLKENYQKKKDLEIGEGVGGTVALTGDHIVIKDLRTDDRVEYTQYLEDEGLVSLLSVPIKSHAKVIGIISVYSRKRRTFGKNIVDLCCTFAESYAAVIEKAQLLQRIELSYINTMDTLIKSLEARDPYTRGHSDRVTNFTIEIGRLMKLSDAQISRLEYVAKLHDIGKLGVPDKILNKGGALTVPEFAEIKLHPARGIEILESFDFLKSTLDAIKHHHENFDGSGYPDNLAGEGIPIFSRIIAVADAYDAMTSDRPYRKGMPSKKALDEIRERSGIQFDPEVVDVFSRIITRSEEEIYDKLHIEPRTDNAEAVS